MILQDVNDTGLALRIYEPEFAPTIANQISDWEPIPELKHLQLLFSSQPYFGRELRYFNDGPWWYKLEFTAPERIGLYAALEFSNIDQYGSVWLNGVHLGEHEGYAVPCSFRVESILLPWQNNTLVVRVSSPWDTEIYGDLAARRTFLVRRNSIKGTYEHSDTFIQRDANPVGIYGSVALRFAEEPCFTKEPELQYRLNEALTEADLTLHYSVSESRSAPCTIRLTCREPRLGQIVYQSELPAVERDNGVLRARIKDVLLWHTWDKGEPLLYTWNAELLRNGHRLDVKEGQVGFRKVEIRRTKEKTEFYLNGRRFYVRGISYFPDMYVSNMCAERYRRDLMAVRTAGFNVLCGYTCKWRIRNSTSSAHSQDLACFRTLSTTGCIRKTTHFLERFSKVFLETVQLLKKHTSVFCWICLNEPGFSDPSGTSKDRLMGQNPGPQLVRALQEADPDRPIIKGSYCKEDLLSGDTHNYTGSLAGDGKHYSDIYGTAEKLNTEFGFDAPPCPFDLKKCASAWDRLKSIAPQFDVIQHYQYSLLKYYMEHYRIQKYAPNSGYVQFLFNDTCPQSFYGLYDWWGLPKKGLEAAIESNQPIGVFLKYNADCIDGIAAVNDSWEDCGMVRLCYHAEEDCGTIVAEGSVEFALGADDGKMVCELSVEAREHPHLNVSLLLEKDGKILAANRYYDVFCILNTFLLPPLVFDKLMVAFIGGADNGSFLCHLGC